MTADLPRTTAITTRNAMTPLELVKTFDQQASEYDARLTKIAPIFNGIHFLLESVFFDLATDARVLCVGVGTGTELVYLAQKFPKWRFTAVDASGAMLDVCRTKAKKTGIIDRCTFHHGFLESLPVSAPHDAATCLLVSQFILNENARSGFFHTIAERLTPGGILASADIASDVRSTAYNNLLKSWCYVMTAMTGGEFSDEKMTEMRAAFGQHVSILPPALVAKVIESGGFETPIQFFQAGLLHAWHARRISD